MTRCKAYTRKGTRCRHDAHYGRLCGVHYRMAETTILNPCIRAIVTFMERRELPHDLTDDDMRVMLAEHHLAAPPKEIAAAAQYRRLAAV